MHSKLSLTKKQIIILSVIVVFLAFLSVVVYERVSPGGIFADLQNDLQRIEPIPGEGYTDLVGNPVALTQFKGKVLVVNSWATWMPFSQTELPALNQLKEKYGDDVVFLAINRMEDKALVNAYLGTLPEMKNITFLIDPADTFYKAVGGYAMPETVVYAKDGTIALHQRGVVVTDELSTLLESLSKQ